MEGCLGFSESRAVPFAQERRDSPRKVLRAWIRRCLERLVLAGRRCLLFAVVSVLWDQYEGGPRRLSVHWEGATEGQSRSKTLIA